MHSEKWHDGKSCEQNQIFSFIKKHIRSVFGNLIITSLYTWSNLIISRHQVSFLLNFRYFRHLFDFRYFRHKLNFRHFCWNWDILDILRCSRSRRACSSKCQELILKWPPKLNLYRHGKRRFGLSHLQHIFIARTSVKKSKWTACGH